MDVGGGEEVVVDDFAGEGDHGEDVEDTEDEFEGVGRGAEHLHLEILLREG